MICKQLDTRATDHWQAHDDLELLKALAIQQIWPPVKDGLNNGRASPAHKRAVPSDVDCHCQNEASIHLEMTIDPEDARVLIDLLRLLSATGPNQSLAAVRPSPHPIDELTPREEDVLACLIDGYSNRQIGLELGIALGTVKSHVSNILSKFGAESRTAVVAMALQRQGWS